ncbi:hypothetical protein [Psychrobacillus sp. FJAT-21963]|uniref:hypothetical protein n=1 Tax=Psychrobacillus sp. FJAT-21963 TaxID=1712028 RepID=UPI0006FB3B39|nr:hypothetical protein [Psychrobacillus sp. FJAT-21963]KQL37207.1 hypothetical protein AN959_04035 [Psychrobacillus sp. FJAT-21963]
MFMLFEKIGLNHKKIHFAFGILLILTGLLMEIEIYMKNMQLELFENNDYKQTKKYQNGVFKTKNEI